MNPDPALPYGAHHTHRRAHPRRRARPSGLLACVRAPWTVVRTFAWTFAWPVVGPVHEWAARGPARRCRAAGPEPAPA